jgi:cell division protein FtsA
MLKMPVRIGTPSGLNGISDTLLNPCYATAVGLVLWGIKNDRKQSWRGNLFSSQLLRMVTMMKRLFG